MSNNNNNNNNNKTSSKERKRQEVQVLEDFLKVSKQRVEEIRVHHARDLNLSESELRVLNNIHGAGMMEGIIAGVATFVVLRRLPLYLTQRAAMARRRGSSYTLESPTASPFHNNNHNNNIQRPGSMWWRSFQFTVDVSLSFLVAAYTSAYMADVDKLAKQVTDIPLLEGRSAISDHFCGVLVQEYQRQWNMMNMKKNTTTTGTTTTGTTTTGMDNSPSHNQQVHDVQQPPLPPPSSFVNHHKSILQQPTLPMLQGYIQFIRNCQHRQAMERRIRQEQGLAKHQPVEIPPPGVVVVSSLSSSLSSVDNKNNNSEPEWKDNDNDDDDSSFVLDHWSQEETASTDWTNEEASSFVMDQQEQQQQQSRK